MVIKPQKYHCLLSSNIHEYYHKLGKDSFAGMKKKQVENDVDFFGKFCFRLCPNTVDNCTQKTKQGSKCILDILIQTCLVSSYFYSHQLIKSHYRIRFLVVEIYLFILVRKKKKKSDFWKPVLNYAHGLWFMVNPPLGDVCRKE